MEIRLSDINSLKQTQINSNKLLEKISIIALGVILALLTWYILKSVSTVLVIEKTSVGKKKCDLNYK